MAIVQISKIQHRSGNIVDLPQLDEAELGWATDVKRLFIGKTSPNENVEVLTSYSKISLSQVEGANGNMNITGSTLAAGQILSYDGTDWVNKGGTAGGLVTLGEASNVQITGGALGYVLQTDGTGNLSWTPKAVLVSYMENITQADPAVITTAEDHFFIDGIEITITNVPGMTELNGNVYYANVLTSNTFSLYSDPSLTITVDSTGYGAFPRTTATNTNAVTDRVTVGDSTAFSVNDSIIFQGTTFGGIVANTTYYVLTKPTSTTITISETEGGAVFSLATDTGSCDVYATGGRAVSTALSNTATAAGGTNTTVQYNYSGVLTGNPNFTFNPDSTPKLLSITGNANVTGNLNASGNVTASSLISNVAIGTAPLTVSSTTRVANLNVSYSNVTDFVKITTVTTGTQYLVLANALTGNVQESANANLSFNSATGLLTAGNIVSNTRFTGNGLTITGTLSGNSNASTIVGGFGIKSVSSTYTDNVAAASSTIPNAAIHGLGTPTLAASNSTVTATNAATMYIHGAPVAGTNMTITNPYALFVAAGNSYFQSNVIVGNLIGTLANGNSNVRIPSANGNVTISSAGNANIVVITGTGANIAGTLNVSGNANVGNIQGFITIFTTGNIDTVNTNLVQNGNSNITLSANSNVDFYIEGNATSRFRVSNSGVIVNGTASISGNANTGNIGTTTLIATTGNITTINSGLMQNGTSNVAITNNGNVTVTAGGISSLIVTNTGANITGTANITGAANIQGNANTGNLGTNTLIATTGNITTINSGLMRNGNSNITITGNSTISMFVQGNTTARMLLTNIGANIAGNANIGNIETTTAIINVGNITTINNGLIQNGNSNMVIEPNGNIRFSVHGSPNVLIVSNPTVTVNGNVEVTANANLANINVTNANITTATIANVNTGLVTSGNSNITLTSNANIDFYIAGNAASRASISSSGITVSGNVVSTSNGIFNTMSVNTSVSASSGTFNSVNTSRIVSGNSNVTVTTNGNISLFVTGNATPRLLATTTGVNVQGTLTATGNANVGNINATTGVLTTGNITTINSGLLQSGNSNITLTPNANIAMYIAGDANARLTLTNLGVNVAGALTATGNANTGNLGTNNFVATTASVSNISVANITQLGSANINVSSNNITLANLTGTPIANFRVANIEIYRPVDILSDLDLYGPLFVQNNINAAANIVLTGNLFANNSNVQAKNLNAIAVYTGSIQNGSNGARITFDPGPNFAFGNIDFYNGPNLRARVFSSGFYVNGNLDQFGGTATLVNVNTNVATANTANIGVINSRILQTANANGLTLSGPSVNVRDNANTLLVSFGTQTTTIYNNLSVTGNFIGNLNVANINASNVSLTNVIGSLATFTTGNITTLNATTGNITTINSGLLRNGNSNISLTANGNIDFYLVGNANSRTRISSAGLEVAGLLNATGNANVGNISANAAIFTTANANIVNTSNIFSANLLTIEGDQVLINHDANVTSAVFSNTSINFNRNIQSFGNLTLSNGTTLNASFVTVRNSFTANTVSATGSANIAGGIITPNISNITTIASGFSNIALTPSGNISFYFANVVLPRFAVTATGANVNGALIVTGNANAGNIGANNAIFTTANVSRVNTANVSTVSANGLILTAPQVTIKDGANNNSTLFGSSDINFYKPVISYGNLTMWPSTVLDSKTLLASDAYISELTVSQNALFNGGVSTPTIYSATTGGDISFYINGNNTVRFNVTPVGVEVAGTITATGNATVGNITSNNNTTTANLTASKYIFQSVQSGISANGNTQANATLLGNTFNVVTSVITGANGVRLPNAAPGMTIYITNRNANTLNVYPFSGDAIDTNAANVPVTQTANTTIQYISTSSTQWYRVN